MCRMQNLILAPESGEEWHTAQGQRSHSVSCKGDRHELAQTAHPADILFTSTAMDHRPSPQKKQRLEKCMRNQVEHAHSNSAHAESHHHVAELRNRGVGENPLDVVLCDRNAGSEQRSNRTHPGHYLPC